MWPRDDDPAHGVFVRDQVEALRSIGHPVDVHVIEGGQGPARYPKSLPLLRRRLAHGDFDVVHTHHALSGLAFWLAAAPGRRPPWLLTHHGIEVFQGWQAPLAAWLTARADKTIVVSPAMAEQLGLGAAEVLPMGVDLAKFVPEEKGTARARLGLPQDGPVVAWVGTDRPEKRLTLAHAAVSVLRRDVPGARLMVVQGRDHDEVPSWLCAADVLLLTSTCEGAPVVVKEALACDRPVVSTDVGDVRGILSQIPGCFVSPATPNALADSLGAALEHGPVDGRRIMQDYDVRRVASRLADTYRELASG